LASSFFSHRKFVLDICGLVGMGHTRESRNRTEEPKTNMGTSIVPSGRTMHSNALREIRSGCFDSLGFAIPISPPSFIEPPRHAPQLGGGAPPPIPRSLHPEKPPNHFD